MDLTRWVLHPGDRAEVTGTVCRVGVGYGVAFDLTVRVPDDSPRPPGARIAVAARAGSASAWEQRVGDRILAEGAWDGRSLAVDTVRDPRPDAPPAASRTIEQMAGPTVRRPHPGPAIGHGDAATQRHAESPLWSDGTLIGRRIDQSLDGAPSRVVLTTHDVRRTEHVLRPVYGDLLDVVPSRWPREAFEAIEAATDLARRHGLTVNVGAAATPEGWHRATLGVAWVTSGLARRVAGVPDELLTVHALLAPAGLPRPPLPEDL